MKKQFRVAVVPILLVGVALACGPAQPETPAELCAQAAGIYMGLQLPVGVESESLEAPGRVTVRYQGMDRVNIPAEGEATCVFADGAAPGSGVESAVVNGEPLGQHEIEALNRKLASP
jgi:hypothetical protein